MRDQTLEFQKLREAVISAQMQTSATLAAEWAHEDEDGLEAFRILELESEDSQALRRELKVAGFSYAILRQAFAAADAVSERCASTGRYRWRLASATEGAERGRVGTDPGGG